MQSAVSHHLLLRPTAPPASASTQRSSRAAPAPRQRRQQQPRRGRGRMATATPAAAAAEGAVWEATPQVLALLRAADAFVFDVDSTFCEDESIDELAAFLGVGEQVAAQTAQAMGGAVPFQDALKQRLDVMRPSAADLERYLGGHPPLLSPGIPELEDGSYAGFDTHEFTSRSGGKREALEFLRQASLGAGAAALALYNGLRDGLRTVVMVGDGATDAEARVPGAAADLFVCYSGVVLRPPVAARADWTIRRIEQLAAALRGAQSSNLPPAGMGLLALGAPQDTQLGRTIMLSRPKQAQSRTARTAPKLLLYGLCLFPLGLVLMLAGPRPQVPQAGAAARRPAAACTGGATAGKLEARDMAARSANAGSGACSLPDLACVLDGQSLLLRPANGSAAQLLQLAHAPPRAPGGAYGLRRSMRAWGAPPDLLDAPAAVDCTPTVLLLAPYRAAVDLAALRRAGWLAAVGTRQVLLPTLFGLPAPAWTDELLPPGARAVTLHEAARQRVCYRNLLVCRPGPSDLHAWGQRVAAAAPAPASPVARARALGAQLGWPGAPPARAPLEILFWGSQFTNLEQLLADCGAGLPAAGGAGVLPARCGALGPGAGAGAVRAAAAAARRADVVVSVGQPWARPFMRPGSALIEVAPFEALPSSAGGEEAWMEGDDVRAFTLSIGDPERSRPGAAEAAGTGPRGRWPAERGAAPPWAHLAAAIVAALGLGGREQYAAARAAGATALCSLRGGVAPAPPGRAWLPCAPALARPKHSLSWVLTGVFAIWAVPLYPRGTVLLLNGACRLAEEHWEGFEQRKEGKDPLPEDDPDPALSPCTIMRCCYDVLSQPSLSHEAQLIKAAVAKIQAEAQLGGLPVYAMGWSSGGHLALMLPAGAAMMVSAVKPSWLDGWIRGVERGGGAYPPVALVHMQRDERVLTQMQKDMQVLAARGVPHQFFQVLPRSVDAAFIRSRLNVTLEQAEAVRKVMARHKVLAANGSVAQDWMDMWQQGWQHAVLRGNTTVTEGQERLPFVEHLGSDVANVAPGVSSGDVNDLLQAAHAYHFVTAHAAQPAARRAATRRTPRKAVGQTTRAEAGAERAAPADEQSEALRNAADAAQQRCDDAMARALAAERACMVALAAQRAAEQEKEEVLQKAAEQDRLAQVSELESDLSDALALAARLEDELSAARRGGAEEPRERA
eukprot:scaffold5.g707.t1